MQCAGITVGYSLTLILIRFNLITLWYYSRYLRMIVVFIWGGASNGVQPPKRVPRSKHLCITQQSVSIYLILLTFTYQERGRQIISGKIKIIKFLCICFHMFIGLNVACRDDSLYLFTFLVMKRCESRIHVGYLSKFTGDNGRINLMWVLYENE